jgi:hypothetical protein
MKPCSSFVLVTVGWYLLMPPFVGGKPDIQAPLSRWDQSAKFSSLGDCSEERDRQIKNVAQEAQLIGKEPGGTSDRYFSDSDQFSVVQQTVSASKCVSSEEQGLRAIELRSGKSHHSRESRRNSKKPIAR